MAETSLEKLEKNFEIFSRGIERLQELEQELNNLPANGFGKDVYIIRSKLKSVTEIPAIEQKLKELKAKIYNNNNQKKNVGERVLEDLDEVASQATKKLEGSLMLEIKSLRHEINLLKKEIQIIKNSNIPLKNRILYERVSANLNKLMFMKKMRYLMEKIVDDERISRTFYFLIRLYSNFKEAIESGEESRIMDNILMEERIPAHLNFMNKMLLGLSKADYYDGRSDYEDMEEYTEQAYQEKGNPYLAEKNTLLSLPEARIS